MELLEKLPLKAAQWLLWDHLPDVDDDDYTLEQLLKYDPRGAFEDNLNDMSKYDAVAAMTTLIHKLLPYTSITKRPMNGNATCVSALKKKNMKRVDSMAHMMSTLMNIQMRTQDY